MQYPSVFARVRVSGRKDEFIVVRADHSACLADLSPVCDRSLIERSVPFALLFAAWDSDGPESASHAHECRVAEVREVLRSSNVLLRQSHAALADLQESIRATLLAIGSSRQLIIDTDRLITAAHCGGFIDGVADVIDGVADGGVS